MSPILQDLEKLARHAGEIIRSSYNQRPGYGSKHEVEHKGVIDLVTEVDHRSEAYLLSEIQKRFPDHRVTAEESGGLEGEERSQWYVDPLDGTVNFAHGLDIFSVSLAYAEDGQMRLGVVYDPIQDELFSAEKDSGAWLNGEPIKVSTVEQLDDSLLVTGFPYDIRTNPENNLDHFAHFMLVSQGVRRLGSAALDLCYIAAGRLDGYWELRLNSWDVAAGGLIVQEAGGKVTNLAGDADYLSPPQSILAANPELHHRLFIELNRDLQS